MKLLAGFDVGGTNARLAVYDASFTCVGQARVRVRDATSPDEIASSLLSLLDEIFDGDSSRKLERTDLHTVGIGLAAQMSADGELIVNAPNLGWRDVALASILRERLRESYGTTRVKIINDLKALLWGEHIGGAVKSTPNVLAVYVGTGIGGAILADGKLIHGAGGKAGEIGHTKVVVNGRLCGCGQRGCVEAYAGGVHLELQVAELAKKHKIHQVFTDESMEIVDLGRADELSQTIPELDELWNRASDYLALTLANACTLLNPNVLLLGGGVLMNCLDFRERVITKLSPLILEAARDELDVRLPTLGDDAGVLGAALLANL